jgi:hypothetical protein
MHTEKPGWRRRYDEANPTVSFRVTREVKEKLDKIRFEQGVSFSDIIVEGAKLRELNHEPLLAVPLGKCRVCNEPIYWNLTLQKNLVTIGQLVNQARFVHKECLINKF